MTFLSRRSVAGSSLASISSQAFVLLASHIQRGIDLNSSWSFYTGLQLIFGRGATDRLERIVHQENYRRLLLVSDPILKSLGIVDRVIAPLRKTSAVWSEFNEGEIEPSSDLAESLVQHAIDFQPDAWIAIGGGSNMDLSKIACAAYSHQAAPSDMFGFNNVPGPIAPLICVPTTAGTGSEVSHAAIVKNSSNGLKTPVLSQRVRPLIAVVDPSLTDTCPAKVTADSGIDALTHAIEAYLATAHDHFEEHPEHGLPYEGAHVLGDMYAEKAITLIGQHFQNAVKQPENTSARDGMALAATFAGYAFSNCGVTLVHALEYWTGGKYDCSHGAGNGILLPEVMRFYLPQRAERLTHIGTLLSGTSTGKLEPEAAIDQVIELRRSVGLPQRLSEVGARTEDLAALAKSAAGLERLIALAPRETSESDLLEILQACL